MKNSPLVPTLSFAISLLVPAMLSAQAQPEPPPEPTPPAAPTVVLTPEQMATITKQLDQIELQITKNRGDAFTTALSQFRSAMASDKAAIDLYQSCIKLVNFDRRDLKAGDFQTWKDRNENQLKDPDFAGALRLQLEYLVLSLQAQQIDDVTPLVPALQAFLVKAVNAVQETTKHTASGAVERGTGRTVTELLNRPVSNSIFSDAYTLNDQFTSKSWEYSPLNIAGIYNKVIFPSYIENKPAELPAQWDIRINAEINLRKAQQSETEFKVYYTETYPRMLWAKAQSLYTNNINALQALADMLKIIRENPTHASAGEWVKHLRQTVNASQPDVVSPGATEAAAAAAAPAVGN